MSGKLQIVIQLVEPSYLCPSLKSMPPLAQGPLIIMGLSFYMAFVTLWCRFVQLATSDPDTNEAGGRDANERNSAATQDFFTVIVLASYGITTQAFFHASMDDPGYLPLRWSPRKRSVQKVLEFCPSCQGYKALRTHHCRRCGRCVRRMDHHCFWIDNCVGIANYSHFLSFLIFHLASTLISLYALCQFIVVGLNRPVMLHYLFLGYSLYFTLFAVLSNAVVVFSLLILIGLLLAVQLRNISANLTIVERNVLTEALRTRPQTNFVNPFDLGFWENVRQILLLNRNDGISWPIQPGTHKYAFVVEQLRQKQERENDRGKRVKVVKSYAGSILPLSHGMSTALNSPSFESRLEVEPGDNLVLLRRTSHWALGHKEGMSEDGWVPSDCVEQQ